MCFYFSDESPLLSCRCSSECFTLSRLVLTASTAAAGMPPTDPRGVDLSRRDVNCCSVSPFSLLARTEEPHWAVGGSAGHAGWELGGVAAVVEVVMAAPCSAVCFGGGALPPGAS